jgi:hypothetical protein
MTNSPRVVRSLFTFVLVFISQSSLVAIAISKSRAGTFAGYLLEGAACLSPLRKARGFFFIDANHTIVGDARKQT